MKSDKEEVNSMRLQATGKYIVWENCKTLLYVVLGLFGIGIFLSLLTGFFNNNVQPSVSGLDISILLILMGVGQFTFKRKWISSSRTISPLRQEPGASTWAISHLLLAHLF